MESSSRALQSASVRMLFHASPVVIQWPFHATQILNAHLILGSGVRNVRASASLADQIHAKNAENPVMVYSKSYCPYCSQVKQLFSSYKVDAKYAELDQIGVPPDLSVPVCL